MSGCADLLDAMEETDEEIQREWREDAPLPSSSQFRHSIDAIMDALPARAEFISAYAANRAQVLWTTLPADIDTPVGAMLKLGQERPFSALLESSASEHAARRRAMKAATENGEELVKVCEI